jgi:chromosome segregation ATPase
MRTNVSLVVFLLASLIISDVFSTNILKKSSNVRMVQMLEKLEFTSTFGKTLITAVQLKLKTGSIEEVYSLLDDLSASIQEQQADADEEYSVNNAAWNQQIAELNDSIEGLNTDLNTQNANLADYQQQQIDHQATYDALVAVGVDLDSQLDALNDWWNGFQDAYNTRQAERQRVLDALDTIISKLTEKYNAGSFIQLKDLVSSLKAVKAQKNPILSLVELTLSFNPATVKNVIDRLSSVRDSVSEGASEDSAYFEYSKNLYTVQQESLSQQIQDNTDAKNAEVVVLAGLRNDIQDTEDRIAADQAELENDQNLLDSTTAAQTAFNTKYDEDTAVRTEEVGVLQHVQEILSSNDSNLRPNESE